jgi:hypothetical protein
MDANTLWSKLQSVHPERIARVSDLVGHISGGAEDLIYRLNELRQGASVANGRIGYVGNPFEQTSEDLEVLVCVARRDFS